MKSFSKAIVNVHRQNPFLIYVKRTNMYMSTDTSFPSFKIPPYMSNSDYRKRINISVTLVSESYVLLYYEKKFICYLSIKYA